MTSGAEIVTLGTPGHDAVEESELVDGDPPRPEEAGPSVRRRPDAARPLLVPEAERRLAEPEPVDGVDEPRRPVPAPELAVGHGPESKPLLKGDHLADALVLELAEPLGGEPAGSGVARGAEQAIGPEEAPDMLGARSWRGAIGHQHGGSASWRKTRLRILPDGLFGSSSTNS